MLEITADVYAWLTSINMFESESDDTSDHKYSLITNFTINEKGNVTIEEQIQKKILTGVYFVKLFGKLNDLLNSLYGNIYRMDERLSNVIEDIRPQIKIKNFEIILDVAKNYYGIVLEEDYKTLLVAGDNWTFCDFLSRLYNFYVELEEKINKEGENNTYKKKKNQNFISQEEGNLRNSTNANMSLNDSNNFNTANTPNTYKTPKIQKIRFREDFVDLEELENNNGGNKPLTQTRSVLEFILIAICKSFSMSPKQSAALLADNKKYLTHIIVKGLSKKNFKPVKQFYQEVLSNLSHFVELIEINSIAYPNQISKNIEMSLSTFKPGLLSKNLDVVYISGRVLTKLAFEFIDKNLISSAWDWFVMPGGGLEVSILCLKKHDSAVEVVVSLLTNFGRYHLFELFSIYLRTFLQNEGAYFSFMSDILEKLSHLKFFTDEFVKNKIKDFFLDLITEGSMSFNINTKIQCVAFLSELWINFSFYLEDEQENFKILNTLKKFTRDNNRLVQYSALTQLFRILTLFAKERNTFAPTIYKTLTFNLIEHHTDFYIKEFIINNFSNVFKVLMSIPVGILVEPYIKQINVSLGSTYFLNLIDINFLVTLTRHPRLNINDAIVVLDVLGKIYFEVETGIYFYSIIRSVFTMILSRYLMNEIGVEFCFKYVKILIETFCKLDKPLSDRIFANAIALNLNPEDNKNLIVLIENRQNFEINDNENENNIQICQVPYNHSGLNLKELTKSACIEMIMDILVINNTFVNNIVKSLLICADLRHYKVFGFHNVGLSKALEFFGNSNEIVHYYNINEDDLDVDKEFEIMIELIYDKPPMRKKFETDNNNVSLLDTGTNSSQTPTRKKSLNGAKSLLSVKAEKEISQVKIKREEFQHLKRMKEESDKKNFLLSKKRKKIDNYNIEHGIYFPSNKTKNISAPVTTDNNYELLDLSREEDRDIILLKKLLKDYQRFFKYIYTKYCGSIYHPIHGKLFNSIKEITETIAPSEIVKMFKEHDICSNKNINHDYSNLISKNEILLLIGLMNLKIFKRKNAKSGINLEEFTELFIQISYYIFSKPPNVFAKYTVSQYTLELIKQFSQHVKNSNNNTENQNFSVVEYQHPDDLITTVEKEICSDVNKKLLRNNNVIIPYNYKKFLDTEVKFSYKVPDCMRGVFPEANVICLEVLDEILYKVLKVHFLESFAYVKEVYKVRPAVVNTKLPLQIREDEIKNLKNNKQQFTNKFQKFQSNKKKKFLSGTGNSSDAESKHKNFKEILKNVKSKIRVKDDVEVELFNPDKSLNHNASASLLGNSDIENENKNENSNDTEKYNESPKIKSRRVSLDNKSGRNSIDNKSKHSAEVINQYKLNKILEEERKKITDKDKEKKRHLRVQYIKHELDKMKESKKEKEAKRNEIIKEETKKKEDKLKRKMESEMKLRNKIKSELEKIKLIKFEEEKKKIEKEKKAKLDQSKKQSDLNVFFYNKQIQKLKEEFRKMTDERNLEDAQKRLEQKFKDKKMEEERIKFNDFFQREKKNVEKEKNLFRLADNLLNRKDIREVMSLYSEHIKLLNEIYTTTKDNSTNKKSIASTTGVHFDEFQLFCVHFNITNLLIDTNEIHFIFKRITNRNEIPFYLDERNFSLALIYICLFSLKNFKPVEAKDEGNSSMMNNNNNSVITTNLFKYSHKLNEGNIQAMDGAALKQFLEFLGLQLPYNRREVENYINIQKSITVKEKNRMLREKSSGLFNHVDLSRIGVGGGNNLKSVNESRLISDYSLII